MLKRKKDELLQLALSKPVRKRIICYVVSLYKNGSPEDTYQIVLEKILGLPESFETTNPSAYLFTMVRNAAYDELRHAESFPEELIANIEEHEKSWLDSEQVDIDTLETQMIASDQLMYVLRAVKRLPQRRKQVFVLKRVYGYSLKEIAGRLNLKENTVEQHMRQAAIQLAHFMGEELPSSPRKWQAAESSVAALGSASVLPQKQTLRA